MECWSKAIADLGMRNGDCGLQIEVSDLQFIFSIQNPQLPLLQYSRGICRMMCLRTLNHVT